MSANFVKFMKSNGVKHIRTAPYHSLLNGLAERFVQTFKWVMRASEKDWSPLSLHVSQLLLSYHSAPHATTNASPSELFLNHKIRILLDLLWPDAERLVNAIQANQKLHHKGHSKERRFFLREAVLVKNFLHRNSWLPGTVLKQSGPISYQVKLQDGKTIERHVDHLCQYSEAYTSLRQPNTSPRSSLHDFDSFPSPSEPTPEPCRTVVSPRQYPQRSRCPPERFVSSYT